jgi:hypothetical protein
MTTEVRACPAPMLPQMHTRFTLQEEKQDHTHGEQLPSPLSTFVRFLTWDHFRDRR